MSLLQIKSNVILNSLCPLMRYVRCLSPDSDQRPDIVAVSSKISDILMKLIDGLHASQTALERRAEKDRKRAQKYFLERHNGHSNHSQVI